MNKKGLSLSEHQALGAELNDIRLRLMEITVQACRAYPINTPAMASLERAERHIEKARSALEELMFQQHGNAGNIRYYYPGAHVRAPHRIKGKAGRDSRWN